MIIKKKDLCQCSLSAGTWFIQENIVHCEDEASSDLQLYYTVNMAVMIYDFIKEIEKDEVRNISLYKEPVKYDPVEIDLVDVKTEKVIGQTYERLAFKRVMKNRESRLYANKIDYLMDTNDANNVFSGHNRYQTILFIGIIIFVIMLIVCLFGKFLGLNSHFQNILATINKITASIKTLLPAALPATVQAAKPPYESDPGLYHHMPELYGKDHFYPNKLEMKCSDIITRYCFCYFHADYPMKFGDAHKYLPFRRYKFLHEENLPVGETVTQMKLHEGYINTNLMRILHEVHGLVTPYSPQIIFQEE